MRTWIKGARIGTSTSDFVGDVLTEDGVIAKVQENGLNAADVAGAEVIDAGGLILIPGGIDAHTHFDLDVGFTRASDDFLTGSVAAACGGTTTVVDHMAFGPAGCRLSHQVGVYRELAKDAVIDYGFHGVIQHVDEQVLLDMGALLETDGISSYKAYMTYDAKLSDADLLRVLERAKELGLVICAHCEDDAIVSTLRARFKAEGCTMPRYHPLSRPAEAEADAVFRFLMLSRVAGGPDTYVVHLSSALGLEAIRTARRMGGQNIWAETCPQYLFLDDSRYVDGAEGLRFVMSPPLRKAADQAALWQAISSGEIATVGSDHAPFTDAQKARGLTDFTACPNGAPGVELRLPLMFSEGFSAGRLTLPELVRLVSTNNAQIFGLSARKGDIAPGLDADLVLIDPAARWTVAKPLLHERVDYTPYENIALTGRPVMTMSRGEVIARDNAFLGAKGRGQYLRRSARPTA